MTLPLQGTRLVEASAGTGKTYTLAALYLRLLLGLGGEAAFPRPLSVEEILVVTFTEAATEELRGRIRDNIHRLRLACMRGESEDPLLAALLAQLDDHRLAALHLLAAERQMDEAAIFTIHGFCQRMLNHSAIESGMLFQQTLLEDETLLRQQVSADFWRRHCYPLPLEVARMVQQHWEGPENLLAELLPYLQGEPPEVRDPPALSESVLARHARIIAGIDDHLADLVGLWRYCRSGRSGRQQRQLAFEHNGNKGVIDGDGLADSVICRDVNQVAIALAPGKQQIVINAVLPGKTGHTGTRDCCTRSILNDME